MTPDQAAIEAAVEAGDYEKALYELGQGEAAPALLQTRADLLMRQGRFEEAIDAWALCVERGIDVELARRRIIKCFLERAAYAEACGEHAVGAASYLAVLRTEGDVDRHWINLGNCYSQMRMFQEALAAYGEALERNPRSPRAWQNQALALMECGEFKRAGASLDRAIECDPDSADSLYYRGVALVNTPARFQRSRRKNQQRAAEFFRRALEVDPEHWPSRQSLAQIR